MSNPAWSPGPPEGVPWATAPLATSLQPGPEPPTPIFVPAAPPRPRAHIEVRPGTRFEQLLSLRRELTAKFEDAKAKLDAVKLAIRNEMILSAPPGTEVIDLPPGSDWPGLTVVWSRRRRFDLKQFRADHPGTYEAYRIPDPRWELRESKPHG